MNHSVMPVDQARGLRALLQQRSTPLRAASRVSRSISIVSGKGGVGKSVLALNLAVSLAQFGKRVCLLDANAGVGQIDLLCQRHGYWNFEHVVNGARQLADVVLTGPAGIDVLPGAHSLWEISSCPRHVQGALFAQLAAFETHYDFVLIDAGCGLPRWSRGLAASSDEALIVTTSEPTALAEAYATVKALLTPEGTALSVVANRADELQAARLLERLQATTTTFLRGRLSMGCGIPDDPLMAESVLARTPLVELSPSAPAARAIRQLAERLLHRPMFRTTSGFFGRIWPMVARSGAETVKSRSENATVAFKEIGPIH